MGTHKRARCTLFLSVLAAICFSQPPQIIFVGVAATTDFGVESTANALYHGHEVSWRGARVSVIDVDEFGFPSNTAIRDSCGGASGRSLALDCDVLPCLEEGANCTFGMYEPGCCTGLELDDATACGDDNGASAICGSFCPPIGESCVAEEGCISSYCFECPEQFAMRDVSIDYDCLRTGTYSYSHGDGDDDATFTWAIGCGWLTENDYVCTAWRNGDHLTHEADGLISVVYPCEAIVEGECGVNATDTDVDCPYTCASSTSTTVEDEPDMCSSFGGIGWWLGDNFLGESLFVAPTSGDVNVKLPELYIGEDNMFNGWYDTDSSTLCPLSTDVSECAEYSPSHAAFLSCVESITYFMVVEGKLHHQDREAVIELAAASDIGKEENVVVAGKVLQIDRDGELRDDGGRRLHEGGRRLSTTTWASFPGQPFTDNDEEQRYPTTTTGTRGHSYRASRQQEDYGRRRRSRIHPT